MARYGDFLYGNAKYGLVPKLTYSVDPMSIVVLDFSSVYLTWYSPAGTFSKIRLVRNQIGFPETEEDGIVIWEEAATEGTVSRSSFTDGVDNPDSVGIVSGRPIYYSIFLFTGTKVWAKAGDIADVIPSDHGSQKKFLDILPRVFTSDVQSPLGVPDEASTLFKFLEGMSFTYEQFLTELDLIRPRHTSDIASHLLLPSEYFSIGLDPEPSTSTRNQKKLVREGLYLYAHKGLKNGLETYVESATGYAPTITVSPNLLLTVQDSTFYQTTGNWTVTNCTLESSKDQVPSTTTYVTDSLYTGKVVAAGAASISLGADNPRGKGIPVVENTSYTFSYKIKSPTSAGSSRMIVTWYDKNQVSLGVDFVSASTAANNTWKTLWEVTTAPANAVYAAISLTFSASGTYYVDEVYAENNYNPVNTSYQEARAIEVLLNPNKTNYINNPSFESSVTNSWTLAGSATAAQDANVPSDTYSGTYSVKITGTGSWSYTSNRMPASAGLYYVASAYVQSSAAIQMSIIARDGAGNIISSGITYPTPSAYASWTRMEQPILIDYSQVSNVSTYEIKFEGSSGSFYIDSVQFEKGATATGYFDGSLPSEFGTIWESTSNNSYSHLYVNKDFKVPHLATTIENWIPPNAFWNIRTVGGVRYTNSVV